VLQAQVRREIYDMNPSENARLVGGSIAVTRSLSSRLRVGVLAGVDRRTFGQGSVHNNENKFGADLSLRLHPTLSVTLSASHINGSAIGSGANYAETREMLSLGYAPALKH
jgi:hypothetical protein